MLTDEEILREWSGDTARPVLGKNKVLSFARAVIAAHEAKRAMPEEWLKKARDLIDALCEHCYTDNLDSARKADERLIAHISTPPAGMVLVPEEPTGAMLDAALRRSRAIDGLELLPRTKELWAAAQIYEGMIAAAKEPK